MMEHVSDSDLITMVADDVAVSNLANLIRLSSTCRHLAQIHSRILLLGLQHHRILTTHLVTAFCLRFLSVDHALSIYAQSPCPAPIHSTNSIIQTLADTSSPSPHAFSFYLLHMRKVDCNQTPARPNRFTFPPLLKASTAAFPTSVGPTQEIHAHVVRFGTHSDVYVATALIDSYSKHSDAESALRMFEEMPARNVVSWNSIVYGLSKCGDVESARKMFEEMPERNLVSWTSMISGYAQNGYFYETLALYEDMSMAGVKPNDVTLVSVLSACANLGALGLGRKIHSFLEDRGFGLNLFVGSALIDLYSKCGMVGDALQLFDRMPERNVVVCSAMIMGLAMNGRAAQGFSIFEEMRMQGMLPNEITFVGVLCACCHAGLVEKGYYYFHCMSQEYSVRPKLQHYACMVDLLGRAGRLGEAYRFIMAMPIEPDVVVWGALLGACRIHRKFKLGAHVARQILELDQQHGGAFVFLSNVYTKHGDWAGIRNVKQMIGMSGMKKMPAKSWIEVNNVVHQFFAGDTSHPQNGRIYRKLDELAKQLEHEGYVPSTNSVVCDVEEEEKERAMYLHSEKIAIAFGLIGTPKEGCIRVVKNLRVCDDCHYFVKLISKIEKREIILRDSNRFHHFAGGICSCQDYW